MTSPPRPLSLLRRGAPAALWRRAQEAEVGIAFAVDTNDVDKIKNIMYKARQEMPDAEALANIGMYVAPGRTEIWLVKKALDAPSL